MNPHTAAALIAQTLVLNSLVASLTSLLTPEQRAQLRARLAEQAQAIDPVEEFEPDCSDYQRARFVEWDQLLAPAPDA
jgi:DNA-binding GntR family transcriptional regulator